jgi:hypothetical protein
MRGCQQAARIVACVVVGLLAPPAKATSLVVLARPGVVVMTIDSKVTLMGTGSPLSPASDTEKKMVVWRDRFALACVGLCGIHARSRNVVLAYQFADLVPRMTAELSSSASLADATSWLSDTLREVMGDIGPFFDGKTITSEKYPFGILVSILVAGSTPTISELWEVEMVLDFQARSVTPRIRRLFPDGKPGVYATTLGESEAVLAVLDGKGPDAAEYQTRLRVLARAPVAELLQSLGNTLVRIQARSTPATVGPPILQAVIANGKVVLRSDP